MIATTITHIADMKIDVNGTEHVVDLKITDIPRDERRQTGRAYVWLNDKLSAQLGTPPDDFTSAAWRRYHRAMIKLMNEVLQGTWNHDVPLVASFSRTAGCSCGCSPGFRLPNQHVDIYVSVK
jgi:hypothetical protein